MTNVPMILATAGMGAGIGATVARRWPASARKLPRCATRLRERSSRTNNPKASDVGFASSKATDATDATDAAAQATLRAVETLAATSARQAESMQALAEMTAHSMLSATGTYVFQLRDRFDEALPNVAIGAGDHSWRAVSDSEIDLAGEGEMDPLDPTVLDHVEALVFHPGDRVRFTARFVCNQSPVRRSLELIVDSVHDGVEVHPASFRSSVGHGTGERFEAASDISTFIELPLDVEVGSLVHGAFAFAVDGRFHVTNLRPEGSIAHLAFRVTLRGIVVPDDDGNGLDLVAVEAALEPDRRTYWLDKNEQVELTLPTGEPSQRKRRLSPQATSPAETWSAESADLARRAPQAPPQYATVTRT